MTIIWMHNQLRQNQTKDRIIDYANELSQCELCYLSTQIVFFFAFDFNSSLMMMVLQDEKQNHTRHLTNYYINSKHQDTQHIIDKKKFIKSCNGGHQPITQTIESRLCCHNCKYVYQNKCGSIGIFAPNFIRFCKLNIIIFYLSMNVMLEQLTCPPLEKEQLTCIEHLDKIKIV